VAICAAVTAVGSRDSRRCSVHLALSLSTVPWIPFSWQPRPRRPCQQARSHTGAGAAAGQRARRAVPRASRGARAGLRNGDARGAGRRLLCCGGRGRRRRPWQGIPVLGDAMGAGERYWCLLHPAELHPNIQQPLRDMNLNVAETRLSSLFLVASLFLFPPYCPRKYPTG
jgi:hypothetical protein